MKLFIKNLLLFLLFFGTISCHQPKIESPLKIRFYSKAYVSFEIINIETPINFEFSYSPNLSAKDLEIMEYKIYSDTIILLELILKREQLYIGEIGLALTGISGVYFGANVSQKKVLK